MKKRWTTYVSTMLLAALAAATHAGDDLNVDFESDMPGMPPQSASYVSAVGSTRAEIVDAQSDPKNPLGDGKALMLEDQDTTHNASAAFLASDDLKTGRLTIKLILSDANTNAEVPYADVRLGEGPPYVATIGPWIDFHGQVVRVQTPTGEQALDNMISPDVVHVLTIDFDTAKGTFTGTMDDKPLTSAGKPGPFPFYKPIKSVNAVQVDCAFSTRTDSRLFVDDIKLGPATPATSPGAGE